VRPQSSLLFLLTQRRELYQNRRASRKGRRFGEPPRHTLWRFAADDAFVTAAERALAFCRGPCFGFPTPTVQRSTEPLLRGKAPASPLTTAPAEMRQEVRPCVSFLAMSLAGRNRPVSTMGVYHRRPIRRATGATRRSSEPPRFDEAKCRAHRTRRALASWCRPDPPRSPIRVDDPAAPDPPRSFSCLSPAVLYPRCNATPSPPKPPHAGVRHRYLSSLPMLAVREVPRSVSVLPRSSSVLPRSSGEVPRWVFKLPRSDPKVPRSGLKVPRSVSLLPRFAAVAAFAFPHPTGLFTPVAAFCRDPRFRTPRFMGVFIPVAAPPRRIRASLGPARFTRVANATPSPPSPPKCRGRWVCRSRYFAKCLDSPRRNNRPRRSRHPRKTTGNIQPALSQGARTILSPCAKCSRSVLAASLWRGNRRSQREAKHAPVRRLVVRGVVPTSQKRPPPSRGLRPASHRNAGQCPNGGGDARRKAENRARQIRGKLVWHRTAALGFGRLRRPRRPRPRGESVESAKHTPTARRTHLKTATRARWHTQGQLWGRADWSEAEIARAKRRAYARTNRARGWEVPEAAVGETQRTTPTPPRGTRQSHRWEDAPRTSTPRRRRAQEQRQFSPQVGTSIALALGRG